MIFIIAFTRRGCALGAALAEALEGRLFAPERFAADFQAEAYGDLTRWTRERFEDPETTGILFVSAAGIAVRAIAPFVRDKLTDPAVVSVDEAGRFAVPLLSGHVGGANALARRVAALTGGTAVISTATDVNGVFAVDLWAKENGLLIGERELAKKISAALLSGETVGFASDYPWTGELPKGVSADAAALGFCVTADERKNPFPETLHLLPRNLALGLGCKRGTTKETLERTVTDCLRRANFDLRRVCCAGSIDLKKDEAGLWELCRAHRWPLRFFSADELQKAEGDFPASDFVRRVTGADNVCQRAAALLSDRIVLPKQAGEGVTLSVGERDVKLTF